MQWIVSVLAFSGALGLTFAAGQAGRATLVPGLATVLEGRGNDELPSKTSRRKKKRWISWLDAPDLETDDRATSKDDDRRLNLAWLSLLMQAMGSHMEPPSAALYGMLEAIPRDRAVGLLRMASAPQDVKNYTSHILELARKHKITLAKANRRADRRQKRSAAVRPPWLTRGSPPGWVRWLAAADSQHELPSRLLAIRPRNGVGNRLLAVASAAALALTLNRSLVILWEDPMFENIVSTASVDAAVLANRFASNQSGPDSGLHVQLLNLVSGWEGFREGAEKVACGTSEPAFELTFANAISATNVLFVESDQFFLPLVHVRASDRYVPRCASHIAQGADDHVCDGNSCHADVVCSGGGHAQPATPETDAPLNELTNLTSRLLSWVFRLAPSTRATVVEEAERLFDGASFVLGVHVRTRMYEYENGLVPEPEIEHVFQCIEAALRHEAPSGKGKPVIFLSTPSDFVKKHARKRFGKRIRTRKVVTDRSSTAGEIDAVVDLALLGMSDALVTSVHSTFSYVAQSLAGVAPYVLTDPQAAQSKETVADMVAPRCQRLRTSCPCFHAGSALLQDSQRAGIAPLSCRRSILDSSAEEFGPWAPCRY